MRAALSKAATAPARFAVAGEARSLATAAASAMTHASAPHQAGSRACETRARTTWRNSERFHRLATLSSHLSSPDPSRKAKIDEIIRVDHAGETAAVRIYEGQVRPASALKRIGSHRV